MEILIAGGSGFLGKQIIKAALTKGHKVAYLSRHEGKGDIFKDPRLTYIKGDITEADKIHLEHRNFDILLTVLERLSPIN